MSEMDDKGFDFMLKEMEQGVAAVAATAPAASQDSDAAAVAVAAAAAANEGAPQPAKDVPLDVDSFEQPVALQARLAMVQAAENPLLEASQPLLRALADMPAKLPNQNAVEALRVMLVREVSAFQLLCDKANLSWKHMAAARYCLCTALDESANRTTWGGGGIWAQKSLLITFEGEVDGGEKFFLLIGRMATDPQEYIDVLEVLFRILGLGFEGRYSVLEDGRRHLDKIRQRILSLLGTARDTVKPELSPHWQGVAAGRLRLLRSVPVWTSASVYALILFGLFTWYKYQLLDTGVGIETRILALAKQPPQPAPKVMPLRLSILLKEEIKRGLVTVDEDAKRSIVTFKGDSMFVPAKSEVQVSIEPTLDKVAREVARVGGRVTIIGHTDSQPIRTAEFPNNQVLSEKRAAFVGQYLQARGTPAARIESVGRGDTEPVAGNATPAERARNRRVDIVVTQ
jgi:type VI secretion system protein ImpK